MEPIKIVRETSPVPKANYIDEIKHIRQYTLDRYGVQAGLKQSKELIDSIMQTQAASIYNSDFKTAVTQLKETFARYKDISDYTTYEEDMSRAIEDFLERVS